MDSHPLGRQAAGHRDWDCDLNYATMGNTISFRNMLAYLKKLWFAWKFRCKQGMTSADLPTAGMAQSFLHWQYRHYDPCKVCGERSCRWAIKLNTPRELDEEHVAHFDNMMDHFGSEFLRRAGKA
jgi:hypothetical protein